MKSRNIQKALAIALAVSVSFSAVAQELRTFTDVDGNKAEAYIKAVTSSSVQLGLPDGGIANVLLEKLIEEDQTYVENWYVENKLGGMKYFEIKVERTKENLGTQDQYVVDITEKEAAFDVSIRSRAPIPLHNIVVEYAMYKKAEERYEKVDGYEILKGQHDIEVLPEREAVKFSTEAMKLKYEQLDAGWIAIGGKARSRDRMKGIWLRITRDGKVLQEYSSPSDIAKREEWPSKSTTSD